MLGRQRGMLAALMNNINSGKLNLTVLLALHSIVHSREAAAVLMILGGLALSALVWIFLKNMYQAVLRRAALELRTFDALPMSHLLFFKSVGRWRRAGLTLLLQSVYESLWGMTIVGGVIKHYSYFMVPFIVAENPDIRPREAILLSRRMMDGHKWECFKLDLSFIGWIVLGFVTFGAGDMLWSVPYRVTAYSEYYALLRQEAKEKGVPGAERLNDDCLFAPADEAVLQERYADILRREDIADEDIVELPRAKPRRKNHAEADLAHPDPVPAGRSIHRSQRRGGARRGRGSPARQPRIHVLSDQGRSRFHRLGVPVLFRWRGRSPLDRSIGDDRTDLHAPEQGVWGARLPIELQRGRRCRHPDAGKSSLHDTGLQRRHYRLQRLQRLF